MASSDEIISIERIAKFIEQSEQTPSADHDQAGVRDRIVVSLHHIHLPKLEEHSVVTYDSRNRTVEYLGDDSLERTVSTLMAGYGRHADAFHPASGREDTQASDDQLSRGTSRADCSRYRPHDWSVSAADIHEQTLPEDLATLVTEYERRIGDRDAFLWKWLHHVFPAIRVSCVSSQYETRVRTLKFLSSMYVVLLDDLVEQYQDRVTFEEVAKIPFPDRTVTPDRQGIDTRYLEFARRVWNEFEETVAQAPRREEFADIFRFDLTQNVNAIDYASVSNATLEMSNLVECERYGAHNMMLFTYLDLDLMHSPAFDERELSALRRVVDTAQEMARIGNWITTWEREIREGDFSSGVLVSALETGIVEANELYRLRESGSEDRAETIIDRIQSENVEASLLDRWVEKQDVLYAREGDVQSVDVSAYRRGIEQVLGYHLASEGWK